MYGSEKNRVLPSCPHPALPTAFAYTIVLYIVLAICAFLTRCDDLTAGSDYYSECAMLTMSNSILQAREVYAITVDDRIWQLLLMYLGYQQYKKSCSGRTHHENTAMFLIACYFSRNSIC